MHTGRPVVLKLVTKTGCVYFLSTRGLLKKQKGRFNTLHMPRATYYNSAKITLNTHFESNRLKKMLYFYGLVPVFQYLIPWSLGTHCVFSSPVSDIDILKWHHYCLYNNVHDDPTP